MIEFSSNPVLNRHLSLRSRQFVESFKLRCIPYSYRIHSFRSTKSQILKKWRKIRDSLSELFLPTMAKRIKLLSLQTYQTFEFQIHQSSWRQTADHRNRLATTPYLLRICVVHCLSRFCGQDCLSHFPNQCDLWLVNLTDLPRSYPKSLMVTGNKQKCSHIGSLYHHTAKQSVEVQLTTNNHEGCCIVVLNHKSCTFIELSGCVQYLNLQTSCAVHPQFMEQ